MQKTPLTREGYFKIEAELISLKTNEMRECLQNLTDAREKGDLTENAEFETAKQALEDLNIRMGKLSTILANSQIIDGIIDNGTVQLLTWVRFKNLTSNKEIEYRIVPEHEIDLKSGKISSLSPIGKGLMDRKVGDRVMVDIPSGKIELEILEIRVK